MLFRSAAVDKNLALSFEAQDVFHHKVAQHMFSGGNLGEVLHAIGSVRTDDDFSGEILKMATVDLVQHLISKGMDPIKSQADIVAYEMEKGAATRVADPENPIISSFASMHKLAIGQPVLITAYEELKDKLAEVDSTLSEAMSHASAS